MLDGNPLHYVADDLAVAAVVETRRERVGVAGELLNVLQRNALFEEVGDGSPETCGM